MKLSPKTKLSPSNFEKTTALSQVASKNFVKILIDLFVDISLIWGIVASKSTDKSQGYN